MGEPGRVLEIVDEEHAIATVDVDGRIRKISLALLEDGGDPVGVGDWALIHMGFAMSRIDERQAAEIRAFLDEPDAMGFGTTPTGGPARP